MYCYVEKGQVGWFLTFFFLFSDKNLVSESSHEVQTSNSRCQSRSFLLRLTFPLSLLLRYCYIQLFSWDGHQCLFYPYCLPSSSYAKPCLVVTFGSSSVPRASFTKSIFTMASQPRIILLLFCSSSDDSNWWLQKSRFPDISSFMLRMPIITVM